MWILYMMALIPAGVGAAFWFYKKQVVWWEWLGGVGVALITSALIHLLAFKVATHDVETWSGHLTQTTHHPYWHESWTEVETYTDSDGKSQTRIVHRSESHPEHWTCYDNLGYSRNVAREEFEMFKSAFGGVVIRDKPWRPNLDSGSPYTYTAKNKTGHIEPVNVTKSFKNKIKAAPSLHSFAKVPEDTDVYEYPKRVSWNVSGRLLGTAANTVTIRNWDQMNSRLGPVKKVNVILIGFGDRGSTSGHLQQAKWVGGKKNDLVLCYGGDPENTWAFVFGWTEEEIVKRNLESILLENPIDTTIISLVEKEIQANYEIKDWSKFDYIAIEPPGWCVWLLLFIMAASQTGFWFWAHWNNLDKTWSVRP